MTYKEKLKLFERYASECQMEADKTAIKQLHQEELFSSISILQSMCSFNLAWLYSVSPEILIHKETIHFLAGNISNLKRKIRIRQFIFFDWVITKNEIKDFNDFKKHVTQHKNIIATDRNSR